MSAETAKKRALRLLEKRDYGRDELVAKLIEKGEDAEDARAVAERFAELSLIDDEKYAALLVRHYAQRGLGRARIREELRRRRLPRELWDAALEELPEVDARVDALLRSRLRGGADRDALRRASDFLRRRGFSWDEIRGAIERYQSEEELYL